jgi:cobalamin biosynthetic protein CobC
MDGFTSHGGRLDAAMRAWPDAPMPWIDLSTGINPRPYPAPRASRAARSRLPLADEVSALEAIAATAFGLDDPAGVAATPGAESALRLLPRVLGAETVWIAEPAYPSHADAWSRAGARRVASEAEAAVVVVVNPNNPDGRFLAPDALRAMADRLAARDGWLVIDESFAETLPGASIAALGHRRIVALRSFGKFYGLAGLRLGFVLGATDLARRVRAGQGDWPVSADAIAAGLAAYADPAWTTRTRTRLIADAARLDAALRDGGFEIVGGTALFRLAKAADAPDRFAALCAQGVLTRPFAGERTWLRFGLPHPSARPRVEAALRAFA